MALTLTHPTSNTLFFLVKDTFSHYPGISSTHKGILHLPIQMVKSHYFPCEHLIPTPVSDRWDSCFSAQLHDPCWRVGDRRRSEFCGNVSEPKMMFSFSGQDSLYSTLHCDWLCCKYRHMLKSFLLHIIKIASLVLVN